MRFRALLAIACAAATALAGCSATAQPRDRQVPVLAAVSLSGALSAVAEAYEADRPAVEIVLSFAGSQTLRAQIENGARFALFAPADPRQIEPLTAQGLVKSPMTLAGNRLAVAVPATNPARIDSFADLARPGLKLIIATKAAPIGVYTQLTLGLAANDPSLGDSFSAAVMANVVSEEENVGQVRTKVALGEADAGIVYRSSPSNSQISIIEIPERYNVTVIYPIVLAAEAGDDAAAFRDFALSPRGQAIFADHGFIPAAEAVRNRVEPTRS